MEVDAAATTGASLASKRCALLAEHYTEGGALWARLTFVEPEFEPFTAICAQEVLLAKFMHRGAGHGRDSSLHTKNANAAPPRGSLASSDPRCEGVSIVVLGPSLESAPITQASRFFGELRALAPNC